MNFIIILTVVKLRVVLTYPRKKHNKERINIRHSETESESPGEKSTTLTNTSRELIFEAQILKNVWVNFKTSFIFYIYERVSIKNDRKIFKNKNVEKFMIFVSFLDVTADVFICKGHYDKRFSTATDNLKVLSSILFEKKCEQAKT